MVPQMFGQRKIGSDFFPYVPALIKSVLFQTIAVANTNNRPTAPNT